MGNNVEGWNDNTPSSMPDWLQVDFVGSKTIDEISLFSLHDNYTVENTPTETQTFTLYGLLNFTVEYWNGSSWVTIPGGSVTGNNKVWRKFTFSPITTTKIRVHITAVPDAWSRIVEVQAFGTSTNDQKVQWIISDQLATPRMVLDQTGSLANMKRHDYLPFGEELFAPTSGRSAAQGYAGGDGVRQQFTQYERDSETQLDYAKARFFSSIQGRFISPDPLLASGRPAVPESWNRYTYVLNNPLALVDPDGLDWGVTEWIDENGVLHLLYHYFEGKVGEHNGRQYKPVDFGTLTYKDINADDGTIVRISNRGILRQVIYAGPSGYGSKAGQEHLNLSVGLLDGTLPFGRHIREFTFGQMGVDTSSPEYINGATISEGVAVGASVFVGGMRIPGCLVQTAAPTRIYSARVLLRSADESGPFHNFPETFDAQIFQGSRTVTYDFFTVDKKGLLNDGIMYRAPGSINGRTGTFEIGVRPSVSGRTEVIIHRFFKPD